MKLLTIGYSEHENNSDFWQMDTMDLQDVNLIVGKNASGKSRVLNVIEALSKLLLNTNNPLYSTGNFDATFESQHGKYRYVVNLADHKVSKELLEIENTIFLERNTDGKGFIFNEDSKQKTNFDIPNNELFAVRRDKLQYPFLQELYNWASSLVKFRFTFDAGKLSFLLTNTNLPNTKLDLKDTGKVAQTFNEGNTKFSSRFKEKIIKDFTEIGFPISDILIREMSTVVLTSTPVPGAKIVGLHVKELDRDGTTDQYVMSDGMFRALSVIIYFAYFELDGNTGCVLIDDIGEGLDFERSVNLIKLLISNAESSNVQLIMSSNDRMVMNNTKLDYWQIISRAANHVKFYNKKNSEEVFKDFTFTGLNNFDLFTTEFYKSGFSEIKDN